MTDNRRVGQRKEGLLATERALRFRAFCAWACAAFPFVCAGGDIADAAIFPAEAVRVDVRSPPEERAKERDFLLGRALGGNKPGLLRLRETELEFAEGRLLDWETAFGLGGGCSACYPSTTGSKYSAATSAQPAVAAAIQMWNSRSILARSAGVGSVASCTAFTSMVRGPYTLAHTA